MMMVYAASTVYHTLFLSEKGIKRLKKIDHMMIFVSIASTYTPICLIALKGFWGWSLLAIIWGLAVIGILIKIFWIHAPRWFSSVIYVTAGWIALIYLFPIINVLGTSGSLWLFIGGGFYTLGAVIYACRSRSDSTTTCIVTEVRPNRSASLQKLTTSPTKTGS